MASESLIIDNVVRRIKKTNKPVYLYVESDYYSRFIVACDKKIKGRYPGFDCAKIPVVTEGRLREILKDIEEHDEFSD